MHDKFPEITHIDQVRQAIKDRPEFIEADKGDYVVFNYMVSHEDSFDCPIRRECRGLIFDKNGKLLSRPFHKFFNLGQVEATQYHKIDWGRPHVILDKRDGSMLRPLLLNGEVRWATKMGVTEIGLMTEKFVISNPKYDDFSKMMIPAWTPIFEYTSPQNQIVLRYPEENLILLAIRHTEEGWYITYPEMCRLASDYDIPVVETIDLKALIR